MIELDVRVSPREVMFTIGELAALLPDLLLTAAPALERAHPDFLARIRLDGDEKQVRTSIDRHLTALRAFSTQYPSVAITVSSIDGGDLHLTAGSFGADEEELKSLFASTASDAWRVLVSFRVEPYAHRHLHDLVLRAVPAGLAPVVNVSPAALAIGFAIQGDRHSIADLVGCLRMAWRQEGSELECILEVEGPKPVLAVVSTWAQWVEIERSLRRKPPAPVREGATPETSGERVTVLAAIPEVERALGNERLSWIDADDQILCLARGTLLALPERVEAGTPSDGAVARRGDGSLYFIRGDRRFEIPPPADDVERRLHGVTTFGALFSDTRGTGTASRTQLMLIGEEREDGPELECVRALDANGEDAFALVTSPSGVRLLTVEVGRGWGHASTQPWHPDENATSLAIVSGSRIAVTVERGARSLLYLVERADLVHARAIALPCVAPQIMGHGGRTIWVTGMAPDPGVKRCDVFRVDLFAGKVIVESAELDSSAFDVVIDEIGSEAVLASHRAVYATSEGSPRELVDLGARAVTGIAYHRVPAVFVRGQAGAQLMLGRERMSVALSSAGYEPRFLSEFHSS